MFFCVCQKQQEQKLIQGFPSFPTFNMTESGPFRMSILPYPLWFAFTPDSD